MFQRLSIFYGQFCATQNIYTIDYLGEFNLFFFSEKCCLRFASGGILVGKWLGIVFSDPAREDQNFTTLIFWGTLLYIERDIFQADRRPIWHSEF